MKKCTGENCPMQMGYDVEKCAAIEKCPYRTWPVTIADRIRSMTDRELAGVLFQFRICRLRRGIGGLIMRDTKLVNALREHAEWARANEWETPITLGDDLAEAADRIEAQAKEIDALRNELCLKCGNYTLAHEGACNGCRWRR